MEVPRNWTGTDFSPSCSGLKSGNLNGLIDLAQAAIKFAQAGSGCNLVRSGSAHACSLKLACGQLRLLTQRSRYTPA